MKLPAIALSVLSCLLTNSVASQAQDRASQIPADVSIAHFAAIDKGVYVGSKPRTKRDFEFLQSLHIRYIVNARFLPLLSFAERRRAQQYGITFLSFPMNASPVPPSEAHINQILFAMRDSALEPVYLHCVLRRDRTSLLSGLYKIYFLGVPVSEAMREMKESGFRTSWFVRGLNAYFEKHAGLRPERTSRLEQAAIVPSTPGAYPRRP